MTLKSGRKRPDAACHPDRALRMIRQITTSGIKGSLHTSSYLRKHLPGLLPGQCSGKSDSISSNYFGSGRKEGFMSL